MKPGSLMAIVLLSLVAVLHFFRLVLGVEVTADGAVIPMWVSGFGVAVPTLVALILWREQKAGPSPPNTR
ncbi:MAG TPA: hypothetical protein VK845_10205 [Gemmatimonadales bacterium]|nr:hypothetical protein [Gemmatimonadales bacterium]